MNGVWLATMYSESYEWIAVGQTKKQAIEAIVQEWNNDDWRESMTTEELNNEYGINCRFIEFGKCEWN